MDATLASIPWWGWLIIFVVVVILCGGVDINITHTNTRNKPPQE